MQLLRFLLLFNRWAMVGHVVVVPDIDVVVPGVEAVTETVTVTVNVPWLLAWSWFRRSVVETETVTIHVLPVGRIYSSCTCALLLPSMDDLVVGVHATAVADADASSNNSTSFVDAAIHSVATNTLPGVSRQLFIAGTALHKSVEAVDYYLHMAGAALRNAVESVDYRWLWDTAAKIMSIVIQPALLCWICWFLKVVVFKQKKKKSTKSKLNPKSVLDKSDQIAMRDYTGSNFEKINGQLRMGKTTVAMKKRIAAIQTAMDKLQIFKGIVYRGVPSLPEVVRAGLVVDAVYCDQAFLSTSREEKQALEFCKDSKTALLFEIVSKTGVDIQADSMFTDEAEVLFRPGTRFLIKCVVGNRIVMEDIA
jgi:ADP-ribosyltransferase exoenzyme